MVRSPHLVADLDIGARITITQAKAPGYKFDMVTCDSGSPEPSPETRSIAVSVLKDRVVECTFTNTHTATPTLTIIRNFLVRRAESLLGEPTRPRLIERQRRFGQAGLKDALGAKVQGSLKDGQASFRTSLGRLTGDQTAAKAQALGVNAGDYGVATRGHRPGWDFWAGGRMAYTDGDGSLSSRFTVLRFGADYLVNDRLLFGVLVQYDYLRETSQSHSIKGGGFMAGP